MTPVYTLRDARRSSPAATSLLKAENLQRTGSFKIRGAVNKIATLSDRRSARAGVVAASAGNHGQAVAWAAREVGVAGDDLHAAGRADGQGRADRAATAPRRGSSACGFEDALADGARARREERRDLRPRRSRTSA